jgi:hypothetical protein
MKMKFVDFCVEIKDDLVKLNEWLKGAVHVETEIKNGRVYVYAFYPDEDKNRFLQIAGRLGKTIDKIENMKWAITPESKEKKYSAEEIFRYKKDHVPCGNTECNFYNKKSRVNCFWGPEGYTMCDLYIPSGLLAKKQEDPENKVKSCPHCGASPLMRQAGVIYGTRSGTHITVCATCNNPV